MHASDLLPLAWLSLLAFAAFVHLKLHPLNYVFKDGLRWMISFPAPMLIYATSLLLSQWIWAPKEAFEGSADIPTAVIMGLRGFEELTWAFHRAIVPLPLAADTFWGTLLQAVIASVTQVGLCCYFVLSLQSGEHLVKRTLVRLKSRWLGILAFALIQWPWWHFGVGEARWPSNLARFVMLEGMLLLAPAPLILAVSTKKLKEVFSRLSFWWQTSLRDLFRLFLTLLPILGLQAYALHLSEHYLSENYASLVVILRCVMVATLHTWVFLCAALILVSSAATASSNSQRRHS